ncbi:ribbon-helix-helix domain-containing protein [Nocardia acidivorans]|uniref:ribbon-helix-helix domain-containing protein n=1 Tax=Nocardia acidivorans TaxID=404580 RepID=UPI000836E496|nr:ribbon-helix-helix domain-containing protein [Nocardia acidivorans]
MNPATPDTTGPGRPAIGSPIPVRLPQHLIDATDAHATALQISRAEAIRRAIERYLDPHPTATNDARAWEGVGGWRGEFAYAIPGDEPQLVEDWAVYPDSDGGISPITAVIRNGEMSLESATGLALSLLAAVELVSRQRASERERA